MEISLGLPCLCIGKGAFLLNGKGPYHKAQQWHGRPKRWVSAKNRLFPSWWVPWKSQKRKENEIPFVKFAKKNMREYIAEIHFKCYVILPIDWALWSITKKEGRKISKRCGQRGRKKPRHYKLSLGWASSSWGMARFCDCGFLATPSLKRAREAEGRRPTKNRRFPSQRGHHEKDSAWSREQQERRRHLMSKIVPQDQTSFCAKNWETLMGVKDALKVI